MRFGRLPPAIKKPKTISVAAVNPHPHCVIAISPSKHISVFTGIYSLKEGNIMTTWEKTLRIVLAILFVAIVATLGSAFTDTSSGWYQGLTLPALQPSPVVFSIVWSALYLLLTVSLSIVLIKSGNSLKPLAPTQPEATNKNFLPLWNNINKSTLLLFLGSGVLNVLWSYTFFILENPAGALFVLIVTIITAALLIADAFRISKAAAYLLVPYLVWLCFALYLNYEVAFLN
jgi:tryptophan-rich sensory protein